MIQIIAESPGWPSQIGCVGALFEASLSFFTAAIDPRAGKFTVTVETGMMAACTRQKAVAVLDSTRSPAEWTRTRAGLSCELELPHHPSRVPSESHTWYTAGVVARRPVTIRLVI